jgi:hypothetical protein
MELITRKDYLDGKATHRQYYGQIVKLAGISFSKDSKIVERCKNSKDPHYNDIGLPAWDVMAASRAPHIQTALKKCGDFFTKAGGVCVMKEAVRQAVESTEDEAIQN